MAQKPNGNGQLISDSRLFASDGLEYLSASDIVPFELTLSSEDQKDSSKVYDALMNYRSAALKALWASDQQASSATSSDSADRSAEPQDAAAMFSLALLGPLLASQARTDSTLVSTTLNVMQSFLSSAPLGSLQKMQAASLDGIESLVSSWLRDQPAEGVKLEDIASVIVNLSLARNQLDSYSSTLGVLLQHVPQDTRIFLGQHAHVASKHHTVALPPSLTQCRGWRLTKAPARNDWQLRHPKHRHMLKRHTRESGWNCDGSCGFKSSQSSSSRIRFRCASGCDYDLCFQCMSEQIHPITSICSDGTFLYISDALAHTISKVGSGCEGSIEGDVVKTLKDVPEGSLASCNGSVFYLRTSPFLKSALCEVLDSSTLQTRASVVLPDEDNARDMSKQTIRFWGDGSHLYRLRCQEHQGTATYTVDKLSVSVPSSFARQQTSPKPSLRMTISKLHYPHIEEPHVIVSDVHKQSSFAGILHAGDVIFKINGTSVNSIDDVESCLASLRKTSQASGTSAPASRRESASSSTVREAGDDATLTLVLEYEKRAIAAELVVSQQLDISSLMSQEMSKSDILFSPIFCASDCLVLLSCVVRMSSHGLSFGGVATSMDVDAAAAEHFAVSMRTGKLVSDLPFSCVSLTGSSTLSSWWAKGMSACMDTRNNVIWTASGGNVDKWAALGTQASPLFQQLSPSEGQTSSEPQTSLTAEQCISLLAFLSHKAALVQSSPAVKEQSQLSGLPLLRVNEDHEQQSPSEAFLSTIVATLGACRSTGNKHVLVQLLEVLALQLSMADARHVSGTQPPTWASDVKALLLELVADESSSVKTAAVTCLCNGRHVLGSVKDYQQLLSVASGTGHAQAALLLAAVAPLLVPEAAASKESRLAYCDAFQSLVTQSAASHVKLISAETPQHVEQSVPETVAAALVARHFFSTLLVSKDASEQTTAALHAMLVSLFEATSTACMDILQHLATASESDKASQSCVYSHLQYSPIGILLPYFLYTETSVLPPAVRRQLLSPSLSVMQNMAKCLLLPQLAVTSPCTVPEPWTKGILVESVHPLEDDYRINKTITIPGVSALYLYFDPRCSSQYDYDKLLVFSGRAGSKTQVAEYGGNSMGFGSASSSGWPKKPLKVTGDTVSFVMEIRSAREDSTPDAAMWGFSVRIKTSEDCGEDSNDSKMPLLLDMLLSTASVSGSIVAQNAVSSSLSEDEKELLRLFSSSLRAGIHWRVLAQQLETGSFNVSSHVEQSPSALAGLQRAVGVAAMPQMAPSMLKAVQPHALQSVLLQALGLHVGAQDEVFDASMLRSNSWLSGLVQKLLTAAFKLIRKLTSLAQLEKSFKIAAVDLKSGEADIFFSSWHKDESKTPDLRLLALLFSPDRRRGDPSEIVRKLSDVIINQTDALIAEEQLLRTSRFAADILSRAELLVSLLSLEPSTPGSAASQAARSASPKSSRASRTMLRSYSHERSSRDFERQGSAPPLLQQQVGSMTQLKPANELQHDTIASIMHFVSANAFNMPAVNGSGILAFLSQQQSHFSQRSETLRDCISFLSSFEDEATHKLAKLFAIRRVHRIIVDIASSSSLDSLQPESSRNNFGTLLQMIVAEIGKNPSALIDGLRIFHLPFQPHDATMIVKSGVVELLSRLVSNSAFVSEDKVHDLSWETIEALAQHCVRWDSDLDYDSEAHINSLFEHMARLLGQQLHRSVAEVCNATPLTIEEAIQSTVKLLKLLEGLSGTRLGLTVVVNNECTAALLTLLLQRDTTPRIMRMIMKLLSASLTRCELTTKVVELLNKLIKNKLSLECSAYEAVIKVIVAKVADLLAPSQPQQTVSRAASHQSSPSKQKPAASEPQTPDRARADAEHVPMEQVEMTPPATQSFIPFSPSGSGDSQALHPHSITLTEMPYGPAGWVCNICDTAGKEPVYHCASCQFDACQPCVRHHMQGNSTGSSSGRYAVNIHRREDQNARDVLQPLLRLQRRSFGGFGDQEPIEFIMRIDREFSSRLSVAAFRGSLMQCMAKALEWARAGIVISVDKDTPGPGAGREAEAVSAASKECRERNSALDRNTSSRRAFLSSAAAGACAHQVISMIHALVATEEAAEDEGAARPWTAALTTVIGDCLDKLPAVVGALAAQAPQPTQEQLQTAYMGVAAFSILGGFRESVHVGAHVIVNRPGFESLVGIVDTFDVNQNEAMVSFAGAPAAESVPLDMLQSQYDDPPQSLVTLQTDRFFDALHALLAQGYGQPLGLQAEASEEGSSAILLRHRVLAELRTRSCMVLAAQLRSPDNGQLFVSKHASTLEMVLRLAADAQRIAGQPIEFIHSNCHHLRAVFFEQHKPSVPLSVRGGKNSSIQIAWSPLQAHPPLKGTIFSNNMRTVMLARRRPGSGGEDGDGDVREAQCTLFSDKRIPDECDTFYFEVTIAQLTGDLFEVGFSPESDASRDSSFTWPEASVVLTRGGVILHHRTSSEVQRLDTQTRLETGDVIGCLWQSSSHTVSFVRNGELLPHSVEGVPRASFSVCRFSGGQSQIDVNFGGGQPFVFDVPTAAHVEADNNDFLEEDPEDPSSIFSFSAAELDGSQHTANTEREPVTAVQCDNGKGFIHSAGYALMTAGTTMQGSTSVGVGEEEVEEENITQKLLKAWEESVFPHISSRFRNSAERRSGLAQIRGALELGMEDIARMTIDGLYEENGGTPEDMHFPTAEELKAQSSKLVANKIGPGMSVRIAGDAVASDFMTPAMQVSRGQLGTVLSVEDSSDLALVDVYIAEDARLVQWWYPISALEQAESTLSVKNTDIETHVDLLVHESRLTRLLCRKAVLPLVDQGLVADTLALYDQLQLHVFEALKATLPATCVVQDAGLQAYLSSAALPQLIAKASALLEQCKSTTQIEQLIELAMRPLSSPQKLMEAASISVGTTRQSKNVGFSRGCGILVAARDDGGSLRAFPANQGGEACWARFYLSADATGPQYAVYPTTAAGHRTPVPLLYLSSNSLHVRTSSQDESPNAKLEFVALPEDLPVAMLLLEHYICNPNTGVSQRIFTSQRVQLFKKLLNMVTDVVTVPQLKENCLHYAAALLRTSPQIIAEIDVGMATPLLEELYALHDSRAEAMKYCIYSTYFQAIFDLVLAFHEQYGDLIFRAPPSAASFGALDVGELSFAPPKQSKSKSKSSSTSSASGKKSRPPSSASAAAPELQAPAPVSSIRTWCGAACDALSLLRHVAGIGSAAATTLPPATAMLTPSEAAAGGALRKLVLIAGFHTTLSKESVEAHVRRLALPFGGVRSVFVDNTLSVVAELKAAALLPGFVQALTDNSSLGEQRKLLVSDVRLPGLQCEHGPAMDKLFTRPEEYDDIVARFAAARVLPNDVIDTKLHAFIESLFAADAAIPLTSITAAAAEHTPAHVLHTLVGKLFDGDTSLLQAFSSDEGKLTCDAVVTAITATALDRPADVMAALLALGLDTSFCKAKQLTAAATWDLAADMQLVAAADEIAEALHISTDLLEVYDFELSEAQLASSGRGMLHAFSLEQQRERFLFLRFLNLELRDVLPMIDLRLLHLKDSLASLVKAANGVLFHSTQRYILTAAINDTAQRIEAKGPEIALDPLEGIAQQADDDEDDFEEQRHASASLSQSQFLQSAKQLSVIDPAELRVKTPSGGDPIYPLVVKFSGERVAGTSGSFRDFMLRMAHELELQVVHLMLPCPSAGLGRNVGRYILNSMSLSVVNYKHLVFFGQLLAIALRSRVPLPINMLPCFWKALLGLPLSREDVYDADKLLDDRLTELESLDDEAAFNKYADEHDVTCDIHNLANDIIPLFEGTEPGARLTFEQRKQFASRAQAFRLEELAAPAAFDAIRHGIRTVLPLEVLNVLTWQNLERSVCGSIRVDLAYLRRHTTYTSGLSDTDAHIIFFWDILAEFSDDELRKFVKFACNQERIPSGVSETAPSEDRTLVHEPPYPMKIAPPDEGRRAGAVDKRLVRAETCLFMIKLPQYSSKEIMKKQLLFAINARDDPLSG